MTRSLVTYILSVRSALLAATLGLTASGAAPATAVAATYLLRPCGKHDVLPDGNLSRKTDNEDEDVDASRPRDPSAEDEWREASPSPEDEEVAVLASI